LERQEKLKFYSFDWRLFICNADSAGKREISISPHLKAEIYGVEINETGENQDY
jgi:hypothetical protein